MRNTYNNSEKDNNKKIIIFIIIIIMLLLLITSCSWTSQFFGKMGEFLPDSVQNLFRNEEEASIKDNTNDREPVLDQELEFDAHDLEVFLEDGETEIGFTYKNINFDEAKFTCTTSNAKIATCYVKRGVVVVKQLAPGSVKIMLSARANGKNFKASTNVNVSSKNTLNVDNSNGGQNNNNQSITRPGNNGGNGSSNNLGGGNTKPTTPSNPSVTPSDPNETKLTFDRSQYYISLIDSYGEKDIYLRTNNLFDGKNVTVNTSADGKSIQICSSDNNCVVLKVNSASDNANIKLKYVGGTESPKDLHFVVSSSQAGDSVINVSGLVAGVEFTNFNLNITSSEKHTVILDATGGLFSEVEKEYSFQVSSDEEIDLAKYDKPYKVDENNPCNIYEFIGYSRNKSSQTPEYAPNAKITGVTEELILYAIYSTTAVPRNNDEKQLWLVDSKLFADAEYVVDTKTNKKEKIIYPGASGVYKMTIKNESSNKITLKRIILKEQNVCVGRQKCLNMGYIIKENNNYPYGSAEAYEILNLHANTVVETDDKYKTTVELGDIEIEPSSFKEFGIFWQWVEKDDNLDTAIGNLAASKRLGANINDMYSLSIGIEFTPLDMTCPNN